MKKLWSDEYQDDVIRLVENEFNGSIQQALDHLESMYVRNKQKRMYYAQLFGGYERVKGIEKTMAENERVKGVLLFLKN